MKPSLKTLSILGLSLLLAACMEPVVDPEVGETLYLKSTDVVMTDETELTVDWDKTFDLDDLEKAFDARLAKRVGAGVGEIPTKLVVEIERVDMRSFGPSRIVYTVSGASSLTGAPLFDTERLEATIELPGGVLKHMLKGRLAERSDRVGIKAMSDVLARSVVFDVFGPPPQR